MIKLLMKRKLLRASYASVIAYVLVLGVLLFGLTACSSTGGTNAKTQTQMASPEEIAADTATGSQPAPASPDEITVPDQSDVQIGDMI